VLNGDKAAERGMPGGVSGECRTVAPEMGKTAIRGPEALKDECTGNGRP
jgi:hypothetical protein